MTDQAENRQESQGSVSLNMGPDADKPMHDTTTTSTAEPVEVNDLNIQTEDLASNQTNNSGMSKRMWMIIAIAVGLLAVAVIGAIYALTRGNLFQGSFSLLTPAQDITLEFDAPDKTFVEFTNASDSYGIKWGLNKEVTSRYNVEIYATKDGDTAELCEVYSANNVPGNFQQTAPLALEVRNAVSSCNLENGDYNLTLKATLIGKTVNTVIPEPAVCQYSDNLEAIANIFELVDKYLDTPGLTYDSAAINRNLDTAYGNANAASSHYSDDYSQELLAALGKLLEQYSRNESCREQAEALMEDLMDLQDRPDNNDDSLSLSIAPEANQTFTPVTPDTTPEERSNFGIVNPVREIVAPATPNSEETQIPELQVFNYQENQYASRDFRDLDLNPYILRGIASGLIDDPNTLRLNGRPVVVNEGGDFCQELELSGPDNTFTLVAENKAGTKTITVTVPHNEKDETRNTDSCNQTAPQPQVELQRFNGAAANLLRTPTNGSLRDTLAGASVISKTIKFKVNIPANVDSAEGGSDLGPDADNDVDSAEGGSDLGPDVTPILFVEPLTINENPDNTGVMERLTITIEDGEFINSITPAMLDFSANTAPLGLSYTFASKSQTKLVLNISASNHTAANSVTNARITFDPTAITNTPDKLVTPAFAINLIDADVPQPQGAKPIVNVDLDKTMLTDSAMPATASYNIDLDSDIANTAIVDLYLMANDNQAIFYLETDKKIDLGSGGTFETSDATGSERRILGTVDNTLTGAKIANGTYVLRLNLKSVNGDPVSGLSDDTSLTIAFPSIPDEDDNDPQGIATINQNTPQTPDEDDNDPQGMATINENTPQTPDEDDNDPQGIATINQNTPQTPDEDVIIPAENQNNGPNEPVVIPTPTIPIVTNTENTQFDNVVSVTQPMDRQVHPSAPDAQANLINSPGVQGSTGPGLLVYPAMAVGSYLLARRRKFNKK